MRGEPDLSIFTPGQAQEAPLSDKLLIGIVSTLAVLGTFGVAGVLTAIALACDIGGNEG